MEGRGGSDPTVSVVVPVYDQPELLADALDSVEAQTFEDLEAIVVDDGSEADFAAVTDRYGDWVRLVSHDENRGAGVARNTGIDAANGELVAFLDADDVWRPSKIEKQYRVFEDGTDDLGLVYTGFVQYELDGSEYEFLPTASGDIYHAELERDRIHPTSTVMIRRSVVDRVGGFDPELPSRQDYDLWIRITEPYRVDYVDEVLVEKREQADSISKDFQRRVEGDLAVYRKVRQRSQHLGLLDRARIRSYHHHVIGRDYDSKEDRWQAITHLGRAILTYPVRPISWVMFVIALVGIDRNGRLLGTLKGFVK